MSAERIRVRGLVQGVGFRPTVWRLAHELGLLGDVRNDGEGVLIRLQPADPTADDSDAIDRFCARLHAECPPLARIDAVERTRLEARLDTTTFAILGSDAGAVHTGIVADAATCPACLAEVRDPADRRYRYPFTNCTHCGPRLSIVRGIPYDRARTSMAAFPMCARCRAEYEDPADRRFHAQPNACPDCGPRLWLVDAGGREIAPVELDAPDAIAAASRLLTEGRILAIKGIGGFHLACDATHDTAVETLRQRKRRFAKPFALMARDPDVIRRHARLSELEAEWLASPAAPILLLERLRESDLAPGIAPGQSTLGFMLPYSPLHHLLLADWDRPLVMTSGNLSDEPPCIDNADALARLSGLADHLLLHDRDIVNRVDDSVWRLMDGRPRPLRRARGYAPAPIRLPPGFASTAPILALGGELKNSVCLIRDGSAILSQHLGDLEEARTAREYRATLALYGELFQHRPEILAVDRHPDYHSTQLGRAWAEREGLTLIEVQHHHAHLASVLADNDWPLDGGAVLGILLDGLGLGEDGTLWGGEFLLGDYRSVQRVGHLTPAAMPGGVRAIREPWRNLLARLEDAGGWEHWRARYPDLEVMRRLEAQPIGLARSLIARGLNAPRSSSAGRLFDAVAAALGLGGETLSYEGQAAIELEALASTFARTSGTESGYVFDLDCSNRPWRLDPTPLWDALLSDLEHGLPPARVAARFHLGFAAAISDMGARLARDLAVETIALSGGVFQNRLLLESVAGGLRDAGLKPLVHRRLPANDGGLALGQACIAAALTSDAAGA
ncbi:carbamoyltransferase HypF [Allochromatium vinosum]|uniref:Carbamoyltransferase HypF n=1 Tax=Allochromatium vinosum (strain ATCC 17899 / DSM 180 / NBRC 103801 / NCIMB 10441 / D) TaxID=572477 RepID=D3RUM3_ALLVD|nr:carbamoyltransferase HypF [Allochromatium vinosum]ADC62882.1 (NiFe) hydrogenase maturation protein HypF [Allochromatium vinosum DSM 180]